MNATMQSHPATQPLKPGYRLPSPAIRAAITRCMAEPPAPGRVLVDGGGRTTPVKSNIVWTPADEPAA